MAIVNPLLAAWDTAGVVRMFEYTAGAFVQTGALGGFTQDNSTPGVGAATVAFLYWMGDDAACAVVREVSSSEVRAAAISPSGALNNDVVIASSASMGPFRAAGIGNQLLYVERVAWPFDGANLATRHTMSVAGILSDGVAILSLSEHHKKVWEFSPDGTKTIWKTTDGDVTFATTADPLADPPEYDHEPDPGFLIDTDFAAWAYDNKTLVIADVAAGRAQSWVYESGAWSFIQELTLPVGDVQHVTMSPDTRKLAISTLDAGTYRTRTYRRTGSFFVVDQDFTGVGRLLDFTADGMLLVDCANQVAYEKQLDESLALAAGAMVNVPVGMRSQALSLGRIDDFGVPTLYDDAIAEFADELADLDNLKITLLTDAAVFNPSHTTLADATNGGAWELSTGGWPAGGVGLTGVVSDSGPGYFSLLCDQVSRVLIETGSTFRNILIYDATSDKPLIFVDLITNRSYAKNRELLIDFRNTEFLRFST